MNEIAVIRRNEEESIPALDALRATFANTIDVHRWDDVRIERVDSNGQITASLAGKPMDELRAVFVAGGLPFHGLPTPSREVVYLQQEREQSLLAALAACNHVKLVNRGVVLAWNRGPFEPPGQLRTLAKLGWRTPTVTHSFDLAGDVVAKLREPEPSREAQDLLVIGLRRHARAGRKPLAGLETLIARTQLHLREAKLDFCTVPIAVGPDGVVAFGLHAGLSADVPRDELMPILREAVA